jgi:hypothetical protein
MNKANIDEIFEGRKKNAHGGRIGYGDGQLVAPTVDGSRPGYAEKVKLKSGTYSGDFKTWYETADIKGQTPLEKYGPFDELGKSKRGVIKSRDYPRYLERKAALKDVRKTGHIPLEEFFAKHGVPDHYRTQMNFTSTSGRRKFNRSWFKKNLEKHVVNLEFSQAGGGGLFIKEPGKKLTEEFVKVFKTPDVTIRPNTVTNINKLWKVYGESHYAKGTFPPIEEVIKKMGGKFDMTPHAAATATRRISQIMNGTNFIGTNGKYISTNVIADKKAAKGILDKFQGAGFDTAYGGANYKINLEIVKEGLPEYTKGQSLNTWRKNARAILKDHGVKFYIKNKQAGFNLNELTGMGSGAQHGSYTSTQFVNLMEGKFNQTKHASLLKKYGEFEGKIKSSLSGPKPNVTKAKKLNKEWIDWRKNWLEGVDSKLKPQVSKILPGFDFRANAAEKVFGKKRLNELLGHGLDVAGETRELRYLKTFGAPETMRKMPTLYEVQKGDPKAIKTMLGKDFKGVVKNSKRGGALLTHEMLNKSKKYKNIKICKTEFSGGGGGLCGKAFAEADPQAYLNKVAKIPGVEQYLKSKDALTLGRSLLDNARKIRAGKNVARIGSFAAYASNPVTLLGGEAWYSWLAGRNEWTKGASLGEAVNEGLWFIPGKHYRDREWHLFEGVPEKDQDLFRQLETIGGLINKEGALQEQLFGQKWDEATKQNELDKLLHASRFDFPTYKKNIAAQGRTDFFQDMASDINWSKTQITPQIEKRIKDVTAKGEDVFEKWKEADPTGASYGALDERIRDYITDKFHKKRTWTSADPYSGEEWNWIKRNLWERPAGALDMSEQALLQRQKKLDELTEDSPNWKELERFWEQETGGKGLTIYDKQDLPPELIQNFLTKFPKYAYMFEGATGGRAGYMGGGIAGIRKPSALPPTGGPMSQGLRSLYINDKDY